MKDEPTGNLDLQYDLSRVRIVPNCASIPPNMEEYSREEANRQAASLEGK
jgi:hypothetical protein